MASESRTDRTEPIKESSRDERIARVVAECSNRLNAGESVDFPEVVALHRDLEPELGQALKAIREFHGVVKADLPVTTIGDYQIVRELGRGGMGVVYEALQISLNRRVALKVLPREFVPSPKALARFQHEAKVASRLSHPGICTVYDAGVEGGTPYIAMQYVEGETLARRIQGAREAGAVSPLTPTEAMAGREGTSTEAQAEGGGAEAGSGKRSTASVSKREIPQVLRLVEKAARALHAAHEAGFVHRDMKPGNIMVTPGGEPVILDFGLAQEEEEGEGGKRITVSGELLGTPAYMSPEQIAASRIKVDRRTDIYSLGVTLYEALTYRLPFDAPTREGIFRKILASDPPDARKLNRHISKDLRVVLETALEKDLGRRYRTALDFAEDLRRVREYEPVRVRPAGPVLKFRRWAQRNPAVATGTLGLFLVLAVGLTIALVLLDRVERERRATQEERDAKTKALRAAESERDAKAKALEAEKRALVEKDEALGAARADRDAKSKALTDREEAFRRSEGMRLSAHALALAESRPSLALLLAIEGAKLEPGLLANNVILACLEQLAECQVLGGPDRLIQAAEFSPDGGRLIMAMRDGTARICEASTGRELLALRGHEDSVKIAVFSPDGTRAITGSEDGTIRVWDAFSGKELGQAAPQRGVPRSAKFSPDGKLVLTVWLYAGPALVFDVSLAGEPRVLKGHSAAVIAGEFSPDGSRIVTASHDKTARVWEAATGKELHVLRKHEDVVNSAHFSPDGRWVLTGSWDATARIWDASTGQELRALKGHRGNIYVSAFSPTGDRIATTSEDRTIRLWDAATGAELHRLEGHGDDVNHLAFSPDGRFVLSASDDRTARIWDAATGSEVLVLKGHDESVGYAAFGAHGRRVLTYSGDSTVRIWTLPPRRDVVSLKGHGGYIQSSAFSPDGQRAVTASEDKTARIWDATTGEEMRVLTGHEGPVHCAVFSPDGRRVLTGSADKTARIWDSETAQAPLVLRGHTAAILCAAFSPDGRRVVTGSSDKTARIWDGATGSQLWALEGHEALACPALFSPDGQRVATGSSGTVRVWDASSGKLLLEKADASNMADLSSIAFSPGGTSVLVTSIGPVPWIWSLSGAQEVIPLRGHEQGQSVNDAAFSPDGRRVVTASDDGTARIWEAATGKELRQLRGHESGVTSAAFSPDGSRVLTASYDGTARIWDASKGEEICTFRGTAGRVLRASFSGDGKRVITRPEGTTPQIWPAGNLLVLAETHKRRELTPDERDRYEVGSPADRLSYRRRWEAEGLRRELELGFPRGLNRYDTLRAAGKLIEPILRFARTTLGDSIDVEAWSSPSRLIRGLEEFARGKDDLKEVAALVDKLKSPSRAPPIQVSRWIRGSPEDLEAMAEKSTVVVFLSAGCSPCLDVVPTLSTIEKKFGEKGVVVLGLLEEDAKEAAAVLERFSQHPALLLALDDQGKTISAFLKGQRKAYLPYAFVVDREGFAVWDGHPNAGLDRVLAEVVAGTFKKDQRALDILDGSDPGFRYLPGTDKTIASGFFPSWGPDGTKLLFTTRLEAGVIGLLDLASGETRDLTPRGSFPSWSPDGGRIAYCIEGLGSTETSEVWVMAADGQGARKVAEGMYPMWAPDGKTLFTCQGKSGKLLAVSLEGGDAEAQVAYRDLDPTARLLVSPDGTRVAACRSEKVAILELATGRELCSWNVGQQAVTFEFSYQGWSPDGRWIVLVSLVQGGSLELYAMNAQTGEAHPLLRGAYLSPDWSRDGSRLALSVLRVEYMALNIGAEIWLLDAKTLLGLSSCPLLLKG